MRRLIGRPTTVRARIVALALAPVLALLVLWSFAMVSVTGELRATFFTPAASATSTQPHETSVSTWIC